MESITYWNYAHYDFRIEIKSKKDSNQETIHIILSGAFKNARAQNPQVFLFARYETLITPRIVIDDIQGNDYFSGLQGNGTGTLLVNIALQFLKERYRDDLEVKGVLSSIGDPEECPAKENCALNRERFWKSFGFRLGVDNLNRQTISAKLGELSSKRSSRLVDGKLPTYIELTKFTLGQGNWK